MILIDLEMPRSCDECPFRHENDDIFREDYRYRECSFPFCGMFVTDYTSSRHPQCPLKEVKSDE